MSWDEWITLAINWVQHWWGADKTCPYCGHDSWTVTGVVELHPSMGWPQAPTTRLGVAYPAFQVICATCGQTVLVNAALVWPKGPLFVDAEEQQ